MNRSNRSNRSRFLLIGLVLAGAGVSVAVVSSRKATADKGKIAAIAPVAPVANAPASPSPVAGLGETPSQPAAPGKTAADFDMDTFLLENDLPKDTWAKYKDKSLDELTAMQAKMDARFQSLKSTTDALATKRGDLLVAGKTDAADRVLADELAPAFEERRRIAAEARLLARAKIDRRAESFLAAAQKVNAKP
jgi:hypothetical protein